MVSKARLDLPLPLGPVTTVSLPSGRSTSMRLRLFWRAPRISTQSAVEDVPTRFFPTTFEPTGDSSRYARSSQIARVKNSLFLETRGELFALLLQLLRNDASERIEKLFVFSQFSLPLLVIDAEKFDDGFVLDVELIEIEIVRAGQTADGRLNRAPGSFAAMDDPFEHPHVLAETGPEKFPVRAFAKPVHVKNKRRIGEALSDLKPMPEVIADVVAAKWQHRHGITPNLANRSGCARGCFRSHRRAEINAVLPVKRLKHERHRIAAASAEDDRANRDAVAFFNIDIERGIVAHGRGEPAVWMRGLFF